MNKPVRSGPEDALPDLNVCRLTLRLLSRGFPEKGAPPPPKRPSPLFQILPSPPGWGEGGGSWGQRGLGHSWSLLWHLFRDLSLCSLSPGGHMASPQDVYHVLARDLAPGLGVWRGALPKADQASSSPCREVSHSAPQRAGPTIGSAGNKSRGLIIHIYLRAALTPSRDPKPKVGAGRGEFCPPRGAKERFLSNSFSSPHGEQFLFIRHPVSPLPPPMSKPRP